MNVDEPHFCEICTKKGFREKVMFNLGLENDLGLSSQSRQLGGG